MTTATPQRTLGIDIALRRSGLCLLRREHARAPWEVERAAVLEIKPKEKLDVLSLGGFLGFGERLHQLIRDWPTPDTVSIEHVTQYGHYQTAMKIQTARCALYQTLQRCYGALDNVYEVSPQQWKHALLGKPNADKALTRERCLLDPEWRRLTQDWIDDPDLVDACLLALYPFCAAVRFEQAASRARA